MITIHPPRLRPQDRVQTPSDKTPSSQTKTYIAPIGGLVSNQPAAVQNEQTAVVLDNFWPTTTGIEPRGGTKLRCSIAGPVGAMFEYRSGSERTYFVADSTSIYEFSDQTPDGSQLTSSVSGQTSDDYSVLEMQTDGGGFLSVVNGQDHLQIYDGTSWQQVTDSSSPFSITNIETDRFTHIWAYRNRQFMIETRSMNAWYLGVNSVAGPATKLPLSGLFKKGGFLMFGATWSSDSGSGLDDRCVFATDQGEFAVFSGADPGDPNSWSLNGVFDLGEPLGRRSTLTVGGDLIVATIAGLIPISAAVNRDASQLKLDSISRPIEPDWRREVELSSDLTGWRIEKWESRNMAVLAPPASGSNRDYCYTVNLETNAWARSTGWRIRDMKVLGGNLHYGDENGDIFLCDTGGTDNGSVFECRACLAFDHMGTPGAIKTAHALRDMWRYRSSINPTLSISLDYVPKFPAAPNTSIDASSIDGQQPTWDVAEWDVAEWAEAEEAYQVLENWSSAYGSGKTLAVQIQLTSGGTNKLSCELISVDLVYSTGSVLV